MGRHAIRRARLVGVSLAAGALLIPGVADAASNGQQGKQGQNVLVDVVPWGAVMQVPTDPLTLHCWQGPSWQA